MKWERGHVSENVEDRRGSSGGRRGAAIGGGAAVLALLAAIVGQALGVDVTGIFGSSSSGGGSSTTTTSTQADDPELVQFVNYLVDDLNGTWKKILGGRYRAANLVLFTDEIDTGCGRSSSAVGPFYCPPDEKAYIDLSFYAILRDRLGADGDFAEAYVLAHEYGHHIQHLLGADEKYDTRQNDVSVRFELQADCYAGVWAHTSADRKLLDAGDIEEAINAAQSIGDDRLEKMAGQRVNPETFTHGTSAQRVKWFRRGFDSGAIDQCDTFSGQP